MKPFKIECDAMLAMLRSDTWTVRDILSFLRRELQPQAGEGTPFKGGDGVTKDVTAKKLPLTAWVSFLQISLYSRSSCLSLFFFLSLLLIPFMIYTYLCI